MDTAEAPPWAPLPSWKRARADLANGHRKGLPPAALDSLRARFASARAAHFITLTLTDAPPLSEQQLGALHQALDATQERGAGL